MKIYTHIIYKMPIPLVVLYQYLRQNERRHTKQGGGGGSHRMALVQNIEKMAHQDCIAVVPIVGNQRRERTKLSNRIF